MRQHHAYEKAVVVHTRTAQLHTNWARATLECDSTMPTKKLLLCIHVQHSCMEASKWGSGNFPHVRGNAQCQLHGRLHVRVRELELECDSTIFTNTYSPGISLQPLQIHVGITSKRSFLSLLRSSQVGVSGLGCSYSYSCTRHSKQKMTSGSCM